MPSTIRADPEGPDQTQGLHGRSDPRRSLQLGQSLDDGSSAAGHSSTGPAAGQTFSPETTQGTGVPPLPGQADAPRLEVVRAAVAGRHSSHSAVEAIAEARRPSTLKVYEGKWRVFSAWCADRSLSPTRLTPPQLADFFLWLFEVKGLSPGTIKGYRSMIADTYRHLGLPNPGADKDLSDLLANLERRRPVRRQLIPNWNLPWVLTWLASERFEPLEMAPLKELTYKTCFLLALATASRVSEIHALSADKNYLQKRADGSIHLVTDPSFIAKNRLPSVGTQEVLLQPLRSSEDDPMARLHDPVRALRTYLRRTRSLRNGRSRLFLPIRRDKEDISIQTISAWLRAVISEAYNDLSPGGAKRLRIRAHEIRAISTSLALQRNCSIKDIVTAVGWRSDSTFARFYLRNLHSQREGLELVGELAASQKALPASRRQ